MKSQIRMTAATDWALHRLCTLSPDLPLGFDPELYLDADSQKARDPTVLPSRGRQRRPEDGAQSRRQFL